MMLMFFCCNDMVTIHYTRPDKANEAPGSKTCRRAQVESLQGILAKANKDDSLKK